LSTKTSSASASSASPPSPLSLSTGVQNHDTIVDVCVYLIRVTDDHSFAFATDISLKLLSIQLYPNTMMHQCTFTKGWKVETLCAYHVYISFHLYNICTFVTINASIVSMLKYYL
jgi:hypothetical protein